MFDRNRNGPWRDDKLVAVIYSEAEMRLFNGGRRRRALAGNIVVA
jgi:hypothetical protein